MSTSLLAQEEWKDSLLSIKMVDSFTGVINVDSLSGNPTRIAKSDARVNKLLKNLWLSRIILRTLLLNKKIRMIQYKLILIIVSNDFKMRKSKHKFLITM